MLDFLANTIEQIDLALEHIRKRDVNNARFALMLIDNAVEITLHQIAADKSREVNSWMYRDRTYEHAKALSAALGRNFDRKVEFARKTGRLDEETAGTIMVMHGFRNDVYHIGIQHEFILPALSEFYFTVACGFLGKFRPSWIAYSPREALPARAQKYLNTRGFSGTPDDYQAACAALADEVIIDAAVFAGTLADHLDQVIEQQDTAIHMIATGGPQTMTRRVAVADTVAWKTAFTAEGQHSRASRDGRAAVRSSSSTGSGKTIRIFPGQILFLPGKKEPMPCATSEILIRRSGNTGIL